MDEPLPVPDLTLRQFVTLLTLKSGRLHGPAITQRSHKLTAGEWPITPGALYTTLQRLEAKGLVSSLLVNARAKNPAHRRRYYQITPRGARALTRTLRILQKLLNHAKHPNSPPKP